MACYFISIKIQVEKMFHIIGDLKDLQVMFRKMKYESCIHISRGGSNNRPLSNSIGGQK